VTCAKTAVSDVEAELRPGVADQPERDVCAGEAPGYLLLFDAGCRLLKGSRAPLVPQGAAAAGTGRHRPDSGAQEPAGVAGSRVGGAHHAVTRSALDAGRRRADAQASGRGRGALAVFPSQHAANVRRVEERSVGRRARRESRARGRWWERAVVMGLVWGVGFALLGAGMIGIDVVGAQGIPREHAHAVRQYFTGVRTACGPKPLFANADEQATVFRVDDPRPGLPPTFEVRGCPGAHQVGESDLVARRGPTDSDVMVAPPDGRAVLPFAAVLGGAVGAGAAALVAGRRRAGALASASGRLLRGLLV
jgi:hypothetical protein